MPGRSDASAHDGAIREQFRLRAATRTAGRRFATAGLDWIVAQLGPRPGDQVLDVEDWLERTQTPPQVAAEIRECFDCELGCVHL